MVTSFDFRNFAKQITGKRVIVRNKPTVSGIHTLKSIIVDDDVPMYYVIHEVCHFIVSTSEDKKKYNLRYGKEDNHGYSMPKSEELEKCFKDERVVGELQEYLIRKYDLLNIVFGRKDIGHPNDYLKFIRTFQKPKGEESLLEDAFKRMEETNKEYGIDIENILSINLKRETKGNI